MIRAEMRLVLPGLFGIPFLAAKILGDFGINAWAWGARAESIRLCRRHSSVRNTPPHRKRRGFVRAVVGIDAPASTSFCAAASEPEQTALCRAVALGVSSECVNWRGSVVPGSKPGQKMILNPNCTLRGPPVPITGLASATSGVAQAQPNWPGTVASTRPNVLFTP